VRRTTPYVGAAHTVDSSRGRPVTWGAVWLSLALCGVSIAWALSLSENTADARLMAWVVSATGLLIGFYLNLLVHELGHLLVAWAMGLKVLGLRILSLRVGLARRVDAGTNGHVLVDVVRARRWVPVRMSLMLVAGPLANLAVAAASAAVVSNQAAPLMLREGAVGVTVAALFGGIGNLLPFRRRSGQESDGRKVLRWMFRPGDVQERIKLALDVAAVKAGGTPQPTANPSAPAGDRHQQLVAAAADPRPEVALAGMSELLRTRPRFDDGWRDYDVVVGFAARTDVAAGVRAGVGGNYALALALTHLRSLEPGVLTDPDAPDVARIAELARLAVTADPESLTARTSVGLVRVLQGRATDARTVLIDVHAGEAPALRARAYAVRGIAEAALGDLDAARRLAAMAHRTLPDEPLNAVLDNVIMRHSPPVAGTS
jgi:Zn-dependent protease